MSNHLVNGMQEIVTYMSNHLVNGLQEIVTYMSNHLVNGMQETVTYMSNHLVNGMQETVTYMSNHLVNGMQETVTYMSNHLVNGMQGPVVQTCTNYVTIGTQDGRIAKLNKVVFVEYSRVRNAVVATLKKSRSVTLKMLCLPIRVVANGNLR